jgi:integrase
MGNISMNYLTKRNSRYYFIRRIPKALKQYDPRRFIKIALKTDCKQLAYKAAIARNNEIEAYWHNLIKTASPHSDERYKAAVNIAQLLGFTYFVASDLANMPLSEIVNRYEKTINDIDAPKKIEAVFGGIEKPQILLSQFWVKFWDYSKNKRLDKSEYQIRKWQNPRERALKNFIQCVGDKPGINLTREDLLKYRDWQITRLDSEKAVSNTVNKEIVFVKTIIETVSDNLSLKLDINHLFRKLILTKDDAKRRLPFETKYIVDVLLNEENLAGLNDEAKNALFAFSETGAGFSELTGLLPEDIVLDHEIPHIIITSRSKQSLKTKYRRRVIPLVGYALDAFKAYPNGFTSYYGKPDNLTCTVSKYLRENKLMPSEKYSPYSLRHSFQDRLLAANAPDRMQADLMGHKFSRPSYGDGASLQHKLEFLKKIQLKE